MRKRASAARAARRSARGFTLIEVMISSTVLAVGLLALAAMQLHAMRGGSQGRHTTAAATIARDQLERFQRMAWTAMPQTVGWVNGAPVTTVVQANPANRVEETYQIQWRITDSVANWTRNVDVRVTWTEVAGSRGTTGANKNLVLSSTRFNW